MKRTIIRMLGSGLAVFSLAAQRVNAASCTASNSTRIDPDGGVVTIKTTCKAVTGEGYLIRYYDKTNLQITCDNGVASTASTKLKCSWCDSTGAYCSGTGEYLSMLEDLASAGTGGGSANVSCTAKAGAGGAYACYYSNGIGSSVPTSVFTFSGCYTGYYARLHNGNTAARCRMNTPLTGQETHATGHIGCCWPCPTYSYASGKGTMTEYTDYTKATFSNGVPVLCSGDWCRSGITETTTNRGNLRCRVHPNPSGKVFSDVAGSFVFSQACEYSSTYVEGSSASGTGTGN